MPNEGEFEDFKPEEPEVSSHHRNKKQLPHRLRTTQLTPTSELKIIHTEDGPKIQLVESAGTQKDVEERISQQISRISSLPDSQRTPDERKYLEKKASDKLNKAS